jgi:hypothetical protein
MTDRHSRDQLADAITRYMNEAITAFAFDEEIFRLRDATTDATVWFVVDSLWYYYDDCTDHLAGPSKPEWDFFQRLVLLLASDSEVEHASQWSVRQLIAAIALLGLGLCIARFGIGWYLIGIALALGPISILLSYWRHHADAEARKRRLGLQPFSSYSELRTVRRKVTGFSKRRYPSHMRIRKVHSPLAESGIWMYTFVLWSLGSPFFLLFQVMPEKQTRIQLRNGDVDPA